MASGNSFDPQVQQNGSNNHNGIESASDDTIEPTVKFKSEFTYLVCGIYGLIIVVLGFVFPISSVLTHEGPVGEEYYLEIFHIYLYAVSLLFLLGLHLCFLYDTCEHKQKLSCCDCKTRDPDGSEVVEARGHFQTISSESKANNEPSNGKTGKGKRTFESNEPGLAVPYDDSITHAYSPENGSSASTHTQAQQNQEQVQDTKESPFIYHGAEGVNFYLRLGAIGFATGSMIHDGFKIAQTFELDDYSKTCYGFLYIVTSVIHLMFTFAQTFFIFKNHKLIVNQYKAVIRLGLTHLVSTNISVWSTTVISEIAENIKHDFELVELVDFGDNFTLSTNELTSTCDEETDSLARRSASFLFPCTIEYSLISAAIIYKIYSNVGTSVKITHSNHQHAAHTPGCHKANRGLFMGLFIAILTVISISLFFVFQANAEIAAYIFYTSEIVLLSISSLASAIGFNRIHKLHFTGSGKGVDSCLLVLSVFGVLVFNCFILISSSASIKSHKVIGSLAFVTAVLAFVQASLQTVFILDGQGRCSTKHKQIMLKPGRTVITFLLMCNLSLWLINTFEMQKTDNFPMHTDYYGSLPWSIISHFCLPLLIFFRFHSSVCLSDIWIEAYEIKEQ